MIYQCPVCMCELAKRWVHHMNGAYYGEFVCPTCGPMLVSGRHGRRITVDAVTPLCPICPGSNAMDLHSTNPLSWVCWHCGTKVARLRGRILPMWTPPSAAEYDEFPDGHVSYPMHRAAAGTY